MVKRGLSKVELGRQSWDSGIHGGYLARCCPTDPGSLVGHTVLVYGSADASSRIVVGYDPKSSWCSIEALCRFHPNLRVSALRCLHLVCLGRQLGSLPERLSTANHSAIRAERSGIQCDGSAAPAPQRLSKGLPLLTQCHLAKVDLGELQVASHASDQHGCPTAVSRGQIDHREQTRRSEP